MCRGSYAQQHDDDVCLGQSVCYCYNTSVSERRGVTHLGQYNWIFSLQPMYTVLPGPSHQLCSVRARGNNTSTLIFTLIYLSDSKQSIWHEPLRNTFYSISVFYGVPRPSFPSKTSVLYAGFTLHVSDSDLNVLFCLIIQFKSHVPCLQCKNVPMLQANKVVSETQHTVRAWLRSCKSLVWFVPCCCRLLLPFLLFWFLLALLSIHRCCSWAVSSRCCS